MQPLQSEQYDFMAMPKLLKPKTKYREQDENEPINNSSYHLMFDKRVIRGNTYASIVTQSQNQSQDQKKPLSTIIKKPLKSINQASNQKDKKTQWGTDPSSPLPVNGRVHISVNTDKYVEILTDKPEEIEKDTLTDFYIDRPLNRLFIYRKDGVEKESQILKNDLFDFDEEVEPILRVLIGKTLEQGRMEVLEEEELFRMKAQKNRFEQRRNGELSEMQRLEAEETRIQDEINRRKLQYGLEKQLATNIHQRFIARLVSKQWLRGLKNNTFDHLEDLGIFRSTLEFGMYNEYMPWLIKETANDIQNSNDFSIEFQTFLNILQGEISHIHNLNVEKMNQNKRNKIIQKEKELEAKEERKKKRKEEKLRKIEEERQAKIRENIRIKLINRSEVKQFNSLPLSDIDGAEKGSISINVFGSFIGELIIFIQSLKKINRFSNIFEEESLLDKLLYSILDNFLTKSTFEISVFDNVFNEIIEIDPTINIDYLLGNINNKAFSEKIKEKIKNNLNCIILNWLNDELSEKIINLVLHYIIENEKGKNVKLVKNPNPQNFQTKTALCVIKPELLSLHLKPNFQELYKNDPEKIERGPEYMYEAEIEDKLIVFQANFDDIKVLTIHETAQEFLRRLFIIELKNYGGQELELELLKEIQQRNDVILDKIRENCLIFEFTG